MDFVGAFSPDNLKFLMEGFMVTLKVAFISIFFSFLIGGLVGTLRFSKMPVVSQVLAVLVEMIRNLPLLLIILFTYFALPELGINLGITVSAIVALTVFESAMLAEIVRGGLNSIEKGQMEAARSSGLSYVQSLRLIILPQALRRMVPNLVSQFISLLKDTSLAIIIALPELLHHAKIIQGQSTKYVIPIFLLISLMYFVVNYALSILAKRLELKRA
ncbi:amino acid ABC transporter permease [Sporosarcina sp. FSL W7-1349]|uniref:amino acid ABC transporter permease n=1 Tax=Sporosarcina sp. FSL W7-1349 TaxID=2921561 RepID=UPI0030F4EBFC